MKIISADQRAAEKSGAKILVTGPPKVGKTSLLRSVNPDQVLFIDLEAGDQAVTDVPVATLRPQTWDECRNLACFLTGPNPSLPPTACYSEAHFGAVRGEFEAMNLDRFDTYFVDSITVAARLSFRWAEAQPEAFAERSGKKDVRSAYGLHAREMIGWLTQLQHARGKNVIFVCVLEQILNEYQRPEWSIQIEGQKTARELPGIVDQIITMNFVDFGDGQPPLRAFACTQPNPWRYPAGDRSGKLEMLEKPHLGELLAKLNTPKERTPLTYLTPEATVTKGETYDGLQ
jgi:AAA domain-containing protein